MAFVTWTAPLPLPRPNRAGEAKRYTTVSTAARNTHIPRPRYESTSSRSHHTNDEIVVHFHEYRSHCYLDQGGPIWYTGKDIHFLMLWLLAILWGGQGPGSGENASPSWRSVVLRKWASEAVTLASLVIQVCTSAQALIYAAGTVLETNGVPLSQVAEFSTMRGANDGSWRLVYLIFRSSIRKFLTLQPLLMPVLLIGTIATQFASTILITDLDVRYLNNRLPRLPNQTQLNLSISDGIRQGTPSKPQCHLKSTDYFAFGEIPLGTNVRSTTGGFTDTGNVKRIFLPLAHDNRTKLHRCSGNAYTFNSRVACVAPVLDGDFQTIDPGSKPLSFVLTMAGNISYEATFNDSGLDMLSLCANGKCLLTQFNCTMPTSGIPGRLGTYNCFPDILNVIDTENFTFSAIVAIVKSHPIQ